MEAPASFDLAAPRSGAEQAPTRRGLRPSPRSGPPWSLVSLVVRLGAGLAVLFVTGWALGFAVLHIGGHVIVRHLDLPVRDFVANHQSAGLRRTMEWVTLAGADRVVLPVAVGLGLLWRRRQRSWIALQALLLAYLGGALLSLTVKVAVHRGRPAAGGIRAITTYAFPSGHALSATAVLGTAALLVWLGPGPHRRRVTFAIIPLLVSLAVGASRLYLGVHWLTDVLAGLTLGGAWAWLVGCLAGPDWPSTPTLIRWHPLTPMRRHRLGRVALAGAALSLVIAFFVAFTPMHDTQPDGHRWSCGAASEVLLGRGPGRRASLPERSTRCVSEAEQQLSVSALMVVVVLSLGMFASVLTRVPGTPVSRQQAGRSAAS